MQCMSIIILIFKLHKYTFSYFQDLKPSNLAVNEDCELKVSEPLHLF